jgi:threonine/homoserine/homoserine lactone efflux protein
VTLDALSPVIAGLGIGLALAGAPGPVQAVLLAEAVRGGAGRGLQALAGASLTFGAMLLALALGLSAATPEGLLLRLLRVVGGGLLLWLAVDAIRSPWDASASSGAKRGLPPAARGSLAVALNPGAWLFLGAVASPLLASAVRVGGTLNGVVAALALMAGAALGDLVVVALGAGGLRRANARVGRWIGRTLALTLASLGIWLVGNGLAP